MTTAQYVYAALMGTAAGLAAASQAGTLPPTVVAWLLVAAAAINGLLRVWPAPPIASAKNEQDGSK